MTFILPSRKERRRAARKAKGDFIAVPHYCNQGRMRQPIYTIEDDGSMRKHMRELGTLTDQPQK